MSGTYVLGVIFVALCIIVCGVLFGTAAIYAGWNLVVPLVWSDAPKVSWLTAFAISVVWTFVSAAIRR